MEFVTYWINHNKITQLHSIYEWTFRAIKYEHSIYERTFSFKYDSNLQKVPKKKRY